MRHKKTYITLASFLITVLAGVYVFAFTGPGQDPPGGEAVLNYVNGKLGIGTATPSEFVTISSSTDGLFTLLRSGGANPVKFRIGTDGAFVINENGGDTLIFNNGSVRLGRNNGLPGGTSIAIGRLNTAGGGDSIAIGTLNDGLGGSAIAIGQENNPLAGSAIAIGQGNSIASGGGISLGRFNSLGAQSGGNSLAIGNYLSTGIGSVYASVIGRGIDANSKLNNGISNSLMVGFNSTIPTLFVGPSSGAGTTGYVGIGTATPQSDLHIAGASGALVLERNSSSYGPSLAFRDTGTYQWIVKNDADGGGANKLQFANSSNVGGSSGINMTMLQNGRVGIGTVSPGYDLDVSGTFAATIKNFDIRHPLDSAKRLIHSTLEGPEIAVFYRGEDQLLNGRAEIKLPDYFEALTRKEGRTVLLTPKFDGDEIISNLAASSVMDGKFTVRAIDSNNPIQKFYWEVKAVRADQPLLQVEK